MPQMEAGFHEATVRTTFLSTTNKDVTFVRVEFVREDGAEADAAFWLSEKAWEYTEEKLATLGWNASEHNYEIAQLNQDPSPLAGTPCRIQVRETEWNGKTRLEVSNVYPVDGGPAARMDEKAAAAFGKAWRKKVNGGGPAESKDDVPF